MILVCDSGSTKADWMVAANGKVINEIYTKGINPFFHSEIMILDSLNSSEEMVKIKDEVKNVYFYGAGCSSDDRNAIVERALQRFFSRASVLVDHDILASALATCGDSEGIACIIGTGSNSCYYDGKQIYHNNYGLGFILGDEASGSYFGKKLLTLYLYHRLPADILKDFEEKWKFDKDAIINRVYHEADANVWLASFARFLTERKNHPWVNDLVKKGMHEFLELYVCGYERYEAMPVHFVGSIAFEFEDILRETGMARGLHIDKIMRKPIQGLTEYLMQKYGS